MEKKTLWAILVILLIVAVAVGFALWKRKEFYDFIKVLIPTPTTQPTQKPLTQKPLTTAFLGCTIDSSNSVQNRDTVERDFVLRVHKPDRM